MTIVTTIMYGWSSKDLGIDTVGNPHTRVVSPSCQVNILYEDWLTDIAVIVRQTYVQYLKQSISKRGFRFAR